MRESRSIFGGVTHVVLRFVKPTQPAGPGQLGRPDQPSRPGRAARYHANDIYRFTNLASRTWSNT